MPERFELLEEVGSGGMGAVWKARDTETGEVVALKLVHAHLARDPDYIARFEREVEVARRIDSPHVVKVLGYGTREGVPYMAMEYVEGRSLRELLQERGRIYWDEAKPLIRQVAEGLAAVHAAGVIHRDVKPSNILISADGTAKLADFGVARALELTRLTGSSTMLGTPHYMAPEGTASPQSDLYSLGCVLFEMLTGHPPFEGDSQQAVIAAHIRDVPRTSELSGEARPLVEWLLAKHPGDRPKSTQDLIRSLDGQRGPATSAHRVPPRWPLAVAGSVVVIVLLGFAVGLVRFGSDSLSADETSQTSTVSGPAATETGSADSGGRSIGTSSAGSTSTATPVSADSGTQTPVAGTLSPATGGGSRGTATATATPRRTTEPARLASISFLGRREGGFCALTYEFSVPGMVSLPALGDDSGYATTASGVLIDGLPMNSGVFHGWKREGDALTVCIDPTAPPAAHTATVYFGADRVSTSFVHSPIFVATATPMPTPTTPPTPLPTVAPSAVARASNFRFYIRRAGVDDMVYNQATDCDRTRPASQFHPGPGEGLCLDWTLDAPRKVYKIRRELRFNGAVIEDHTYSFEMSAGTWYNSTPSNTPGRYDWTWYFDDAPIGTGTVVVP